MIRYACMDSYCRHVYGDMRDLAFVWPRCAHCGGDLRFTCRQIDEETYQELLQLQEEAA